MTTKEFVPTGRCYMLCEAGDLVLEWSVEHEDSMRKLIEAKIKEGYSFFIVKKVFGISRNVKVRSIDQIKVGAKLLLKDDDALRLFEAGSIRVGAPDTTHLETERLETDPEVILKNECVAVRPIAAG